MQEKILLERLFENVTCMKSMQHIKLNKSSSPHEICLTALVCLDIFRGLRKYAYPKVKHVRKELSHLIQSKVYPSHYPEGFKKAYGSLQMDFNIVHILEEDILKFNNTVKTLIKPRLENWMYNHTRLLVSDYFFNQLLELKTSTNIFKALSSLMNNHQRLIEGRCTNFEHTVLHRPTPLEGSCHYTPFSDKLRELPHLYLNAACFIGFVPTQGANMKRNLMLKGELEGKIVCSEYWESMSTNMEKAEALRPLLLSGTYKRMINHHAGSGKTKHKIEGESNYHFHTKPTGNEHFVIRNEFPEDHIVSNVTGHFRLNRVLPCPIQYIELLDESYTAQNYLRKLAAPIATQNFLEEFDGNALVKILESIPGFVYKFSQQQRDLISSHHNCVVVGRSGTGKTTCAVMRMIGIRLLEIADRNAQQGIKKIRYKDLCERTYIKMVFITASPLLARNISKMYHRVLNYLKSMLYEKEKKAASPVKTPTVVHQNKEAEDEFEVIEENDGGEEKKKERKENNSHMVTEAMEGFDLKVLEEAEKEIEQMLDDININEDSNEVPNSFYKVGIDDFPLFLTLKEFLYLMDSLMATSFFARNVDNLIRAGIKRTTGKKGFYRYKDTKSANRLHDSLLFREMFTAKYTVEISSDEDEENEVVEVGPKDENITGAELKESANSNGIMCSEDLVTEVDYQDFVDAFLPLYIKSKKGYSRHSIEPNSVWQQIRNMDLQFASKYSGNVDPDAIDMYKAYKSWKDNSGSYDLNDIYMHLYNSHEIDMVAGNLIDFLYLDEIQDIPEHLLNYLRKFGSKYFYFSGDNAQNITKGVTFKFADLAKTYNSYKKSKLSTDFFALKINFRSHQQILDLGNNIVYLLRMFFPETLEYLPPEKSEVEGATPVILPQDSTEEDLIKFMKECMGLQEESVVNEMSDMKMVSSNYKFANSQVFITRDYRSKQSLLEKFPNAIVLTILEAKGMEFDDIILYNYFIDSNNKAMLLYGKCIEVITNRVKQKKEESVASDRIKFYKEAKDQEGGYIEYELTVDKTLLVRHADELTPTERSDNADELKLLYVAITRARKRVLIFDEPKGNLAKSSRSIFDSLWFDLNLAKNAFSEAAIAEFKASAPIEKIREKKKWIRDGIEYMQKSHYDFAELCFRSAGFEKGMTLAHLCKTTVSLKRDYFLLNAVNSQNKEEQEEIEEKRIFLKDKLKELGDDFIRNGWHEQAIQAYSVGGFLNLCAETLKEKKIYKRAADYYFELGLYEDALECYKLASDYLGMVSCLQSEKNLGNLLALFNIVKDKIKPSEVPALKSIARKSLREELFKMNQFLLAGEMEAVEKEGKVDMQKLAEDIEDIEEGREVRTIPDSSIENKSDNYSEYDRPPLNKSVSDFEDDTGSFKVVDMDEVMSNKGSFEFVNSEIDELEKMSESFVDVSIQGQKVVTNSSLFEDFTSVMDKHFSFKENEILIKAINLCHSHYEGLIKSKNTIDQDEGKVLEIDMIELPESQVMGIIKFINSCGAYTLRLLVERKLGVKNHLLSLLVSYLFQTTPVQTTVANGIIKVPSKTTEAVLQHIAKTMTSNCNEVRRLASMSFLNVLQRCDQRSVRKLMENNDIDARTSMSLIVLLGYFRQLVHLLPPQMASKMLGAFGEIQTLIMLKITNNEVQIFDREALLTDLIVGTGMKKLSVVYAYFEDHIDVIKSGLFYFSIHYLWNEKTYFADNFDNDLKEINERSSYIATALSIVKDLVSGNYEAGFEKVQAINITQVALANTIEGGYLAGVLLKCFYFCSNFLSPKIYKEKGYKQCQAHIKPYLNFYKYTILYKSKQNWFIEGILLTLSVSLIPANCPPLSVFSPAGTLVHRSSQVLKIIVNLQATTSTPGLEYELTATQRLRLLELDFPVILVADCGQEFFNIKIDYIFKMLNILALENIEHVEQQQKTKKQINLSEDWISETLDYYAKNFAAKQAKEKLKKGIKITAKDELVRDSVIKSKKRQIENINKNGPQINRAQEAMFRELMIGDWTGNYADTLSYSFNTVSKILIGKIRSFNFYTRSSEAIKYIYLLLNICITHDKMHLFNHHVKVMEKKFEKISHIFFNLADSEYSWRTGNVNEFVLERVALFEDVSEKSVEDPQLGFFLSYFAEDIALGYTLGQNLAEVSVPSRVYQRRLETNPLFKTNSKLSGKMIILQSKNPFGQLEKTTISLVKKLLTRFATTPAIKAIKKDFPALSEQVIREDDHPEEEVNTMSSPTIKAMKISLKVLSPEEVKANQKANIKAYEDLLASFETSEIDLQRLIACMKKAYHLSKTMQKDMILTRKDQPLELSYNTKMLVRDQNARAQTLNLNKKMTLKKNKAVYLLGRLYRVTQRALTQIENQPLITSMSTPKVIDIVQVVVSCQMIEEDIIQACVAQEIPTCDEFVVLVAGQEDALTDIITTRIYPKETNEESLGERSMNSRLDKIRGSIYASYNKTRQLSRRIWQMKKACQ